ncbi:MAG TPA: substrate-binding domain-containing protein [Anaeromyxobacter sp.]|nr:substrate-binding domain-containing protein [Anaeromyxobacter sp.]
MPARRKVVVSLLTARQEFQRQQEEDARAAASRSGLEVQVVYAENDPATQIRQLEAFIREPLDSRPSAFVVETVAAVGFEKVARSALSARIGWVVISARAPYLDILRRDFPGALVTSATTDDLEIGRIQARHFLALLPSGGKVLYVEGPSMSAATIFRRRMAEQELKGSRVSIAQVVSGDWTAGGAEWAVSSWLGLDESHETRFDLVGAQNDEMALGARAALSAQRPDWSGPVTGCDGLVNGGQRYVREGQLAATVVKPTTAGPGVELVAKSLRGEPVPPQLILPPRSFPPLENLKQ